MDRQLINSLNLHSMTLLMKLTCINDGNIVSDWFVDVNKPITSGRRRY